MALVCLAATALATLLPSRRSTTFLTTDETLDFIRKDPDDYVKNMSHADLAARKLRSKEDYARVASRVCADFTSHEKRLIDRLASRIDQRAKDFDGGRLSRLPWFFAKTRGDALEDGLPYTRGHVIFLPSDMIRDEGSLLPKVLAHEKVHVYQRTYPERTRAFHAAMGFRPLRVKGSIGRDALLRSNPDEDVYVYARHGHPVGTYFNSHRPEHLSDVRGHPHPHEVMASLLEVKLASSKRDS